MNIPLRNFMLLTALTLLGSPLVMAQQAQSKSKPVRQVTENTLPAPKTEQVSPPVKGVGTVVKRNPGSGASKISNITNAQGETTVTITEKGNYVVTVVQPNQDGVVRTKQNGQPIQGVRIGLAKHPGNYFIRFVPTNDKGEVEFKDLEPRSYTIKIISNEVNCPPGFIMNNGVCEPLPKVATDQPVKAAINIRPELVNLEATPEPAAVTEKSDEKKLQITSLEEQLKTIGAEKINSLIKNRKVTVESVFNKIKAYKTTSDTKVKTDLLLDLCTLSNPELNILLSKFGEKNEENAKLDVAFENYFKRADALVGQNVFIAGLDKNNSEKLNALNKTIINGDYKRPELIILGIAERDCRGAICPRCPGWGCVPYGSSSVDSTENLSKPKCPPGYTLMPNGECAPNEDLPKEMPKDLQIIKQVQTVSLEEQLKTLGAEKINSLTKDRKVSIETVFNKIKTYKTTSDTRIKTDLLLDLCTLTNSELNDLLSRFGEKNEENAKLDRAFANYFKRADALVGQNVFIASLDKGKSEKLDALNKTIINGDYKRPELIIFGIAEVICWGMPCFRCPGSGCIPPPEPEKPKGK